MLDRGILSGPFAPESMALEQEFARHVGAKHCLLTHCGTSALVVALAAAGVRRFRIELVRQVADEVTQLVRAYRALMAGSRTPAEIWRELRSAATGGGAHEGYGVVRGSLRVIS